MVIKIPVLIRTGSVKRILDFMKTEYQRRALATDCPDQSSFIRNARWPRRFVWLKLSKGRLKIHIRKITQVPEGNSKLAQLVLTS